MFSFRPLFRAALWTCRLSLAADQAGSRILPPKRLFAFCATSCSFEIAP